MAKKGMTLYKYEVVTVQMKDAKQGKTTTISPYKDAEMVIKSIQSEMMKAKTVAISAVMKETRKVSVDLDALWNEAKDAAKPVEAKKDKPTPRKAKTTKPAAPTTEGETENV